MCVCHCSKKQEKIDGNDLYAQECRMLHSNIDDCLMPVARRLQCHCWTMRRETQFLDGDGEKNRRRIHNECSTDVAIFESDAMAGQAVSRYMDSTRILENGGGSRTGYGRRIDQRRGCRCAGCGGLSPGRRRRTVPVAGAGTTPAGRYIPSLGRVV